MKRFKSILSCLLTLALLVTSVVGVLPVSAAMWSDTDLEAKGFDYGFAPAGYSEDMSYLDNDFTVYHYTRAPATFDAAAAKSTNKPSDVVSTDASGNQFKAIFTNGLPGFKVNTTNGLSMATYKTKSYTDFYAEYGVSYSGQRLGLVFGGTLGNLGVVNDADAANETAVYVTVLNDGKAYVAGAVDPTNATTNATKETASEFITNSVLGSNVAWAGADLGSDVTTATICVEVKDGFVRVYRKGESNLLKVKLSDSYVGGYVSLFMTNSSGSYFTSFGIREEQSNDYAFDTVQYSENLDYLDEDFTAYTFNRKPATTAAAEALKSWKPSDKADGDFKAVFTSGLPGFKMQTSPGAFGMLTYKTTEYTYFHAEYDITNTEQTAGFAFGGAPGNLGVVADSDATNDKAVHVFVMKSGRTFLVGAVDTGTVETNGTVLNTAGAYVTASLLGDNVACVGADLGDDLSDSTVCVDVKDGYVTVSRKGEETYLKAKLTDAYTGGYVSLTMANASDTMFTGFRIKGTEKVLLDTVYLSATGDDTAAGNTAETAVATLEKAMELVTDGGTIQVVGTYKLDKFVESTKAVTFTGGGTLDLTGQADDKGTIGWVRLYAPTTFDNISLEFKDITTNFPANLLAQCNPLRITENAKLNRTINVFGGYQLANIGDTHTGNTHIELYAGKYKQIGGANRQGILVGDTYVKVGGTASATDLYGGTAASYGNINGETYVYIEGGTFTNVYGGHQMSGTLNGTHIYVNGGKISNLYGGNFKASMKYTGYATNQKLASTEVVLNGGEVTCQLYGGCWNSVSADIKGSKNHVFGTTSVTIKEGVIFGTNTGYWEGIRAGSRTQIETYEADTGCEETATLYFDKVSTRDSLSAYLNGADSAGMRHFKFVDTTDTTICIEGTEKDSLDTVYLSATGDDTAAGNTTDTAVATLKKAMDLVKDGGTVQVVGTYKLDAFVETAKAVTFAGGTLDLTGQPELIPLYSPTTFGNITLKFGKVAYLLAQGNRLIVSADAKISGSNVNVYGGYQMTNIGDTYTGDTHIELYAGKYNQIGGANRRGKLVGNTYVKVGGTVSANGVYGGTVGDFGTVNGETYVYVEGGNFGNVFGGSWMSGVVNGTHVYVKGGTIEGLFGGSHGANNQDGNMKYMGYSATNQVLASTEVVLSGGVVTRQLYGGSWNGTDGRNHHVYGTTSVTIKEGFQFGTHVNWEGIRAGSRTQSETYEADTGCEETATLYFDKPSTRDSLSAYLDGKDSANRQQYKLVDTTDTTQLYIEGKFDTVYLSATGDDTAAGDTADTAVATLDKAMELVTDGGTIQVVEEYKLDAFVESVKAVTFAGGTLDLSGQKDDRNQTGWVRLYAPTTFGNITLKFGNLAYVMAQCNRLIVSADATIIGKTVNVYGGYQLTNIGDTHTGDTHIELYAGKYNQIGGANRRGRLVGNTYVKVGGTASATDLYGGTVGDYGTVNGETHVYVEGGTFTNVYGGSQMSDTVNGTHIYVNGGKINNLYGGSFKSSMKHIEYFTNQKPTSTEVVLNGGEITCQLYGGCWNSVSPAITGSKNHVFGTTSVTINEGVIFGTNTGYWEGIRAGSRTQITTYEADGAETSTLYFDSIRTHKDLMKYLGGADSAGMQQQKFVDTTDTTVYTNDQNKNGTITQTAADNADGTATYTFVVALAGDYEVYAGTLLATDKKGVQYVPTRVGFREDMNAATYTVTAPGYVMLNAEFIQPTAAQPNLGNIGHSINTSVLGLRLVSRINRLVAEDNTLSVKLGGKNFTVSDYGMVFTTQAAIDWGTANGVGTTLELNSTNSYIKSYSHFKNNICYDICNAYVDVSVAFTGLDKVNGGENLQMWARPYIVYVDAEGQEQSLYGSAFSSTYAEAVKAYDSSFSTVYLSETGNDFNFGDTAENAVATYERAMELITDGGTIQVAGKHKIDAFVKSDKAVTFTGGGTLDLTGQRDDTKNAFGWVYLYSPTTFDDISLEFKDVASGYPANLLAQGNALYITENAKINKLINVFGGSELPEGPAASTRFNTSLKLYSGTYGTIAGGNRTGLLHGNTYVEVGGTAGHNVGQGGHIYGGSGDAWGAIDGTTNVVINGGNWEGVFGGDEFSPAVNAANVTVNGGTIESVFGGNESYGMEPYSKDLTASTVTVTLNGGTVTRRVYGGCYNNYDTTTENHVKGTATVTIGDGFTFSGTHEELGVRAWEGIRAGSRMATNSEEETATLNFQSQAKLDSMSAYIGPNDSSIVNGGFDIANTTDGDPVVLG